jgi:hypothetical protein
MVQYIRAQRSANSAISASVAILVQRNILARIIRIFNVVKNSAN